MNNSQNPAQFCTAFVSNFMFEYGAEVDMPKNYRYTIKNISYT